MNTIDAIRAVLNATSDYGGANGARETLRELVIAYDALAPDWSQAPDGAQWYTVDTNGCAWHDDVEPSLFESCWESDTAAWGGIVLIPLGLDWRLLKWQRPEVA